MDSHRVLAPGGFLLFNNGIMLEDIEQTFPDVYAALQRRDEFDAWLEEERTGHYVPPSQRYDTRRGYETLLESVGFSIVHTHLDVSDHAWGIVIWARKP